MALLEAGVAAVFARATGDGFVTAFVEAATCAAGEGAAGFGVRGGIGVGSEQGQRITGRFGPARSLSGLCAAPSGDGGIAELACEQCAFQDRKLHGTDGDFQ